MLARSDRRRQRRSSSSTSCTRSSAPAGPKAAATPPICSSRPWPAASSAASAPPRSTNIANTWKKTPPWSAASSRSSVGEPIGRGHDRHPPRPEAPLRGPSQGREDQGLGPGGGGQPLAPLHRRPLPARQGHRPDGRGRQPAGDGVGKRAAARSTRCSGGWCNSNWPTANWPTRPRSTPSSAARKSRRRWPSCAASWPICASNGNWKRAAWATCSRSASKLDRRRVAVQPACRRRSRRSSRPACRSRGRLPEALRVGHAAEEAAAPVGTQNRPSDKPAEPATGRRLLRRRSARRKSPRSSAPGPAFPSAA